MPEVTISLERFQQLIRSEQDANLLKNLITERFNGFRPLDYDEVKLIYKIFYGDEE